MHTYNNSFYHTTYYLPKNICSSSWLSPAIDTLYRVWGRCAGEKGQTQLSPWNVGSEMVSRPMEMFLNHYCKLAYWKYKNSFWRIIGCNVKIFRCHSYMTLKQWKKRPKGCFHVTFIEPYSKSWAGHRETQMNKAFSLPFNNSYSCQRHRHASI